MSDLPHNGLFYLALVFAPMFVGRLAIVQWLHAAKPAQPRRAWIAFQIAAGVWAFLVLMVIMPLAYGRPVLWGPPWVS